MRLKGIAGKQDQLTREKELYEMQRALGSGRIHPGYTARAGSTSANAIQISTKAPHTRHQGHLHSSSDGPTASANETPKTSQSVSLEKDQDEGTMPTEQMKHKSVTGLTGTTTEVGTWELIKIDETSLDCAGGIRALLQLPNTAKQSTYG